MVKGVYQTTMRTEIDQALRNFKLWILRENVEPSSPRAAQEFSGLCKAARVSGEIKLVLGGRFPALIAEMVFGEVRVYQPLKMYEPK